MVESPQWRYELHTAPGRGTPERNPHYIGPYRTCKNFVSAIMQKTKDN